MTLRKTIAITYGLATGILAAPLAALALVVLFLWLTIYLVRHWMRVRQILGRDLVIRTIADPRLCDMAMYALF